MVKSFVLLVAVLLCVPCQAQQRTWVSTKNIRANTGTVITLTSNLITSSGVITNTANIITQTSQTISTSNLGATTGTVGTLNLGSLVCSTITSGTYTPTRSAESNLAGNADLTVAQWMRVGNVVMVSGRFTADPSLALASGFEISLPIASNLATTSDLAGIAHSGAVAALSAEVSGAASNDTAKITWVAVDLLARSWSYQFSYQVK